MAYKIRVPKKKEAPTLKMASRSEAFLEALLSRPKLIFGFLAAGVLIIVLTYGWRAMNEKTEEAAWTLEAEAAKFFHEPAPLPEPIEEGQEDAPLVITDPVERLKRSAALYDEILEKYPASRAAPIARFESGNVYYALEEYDKAEARLSSFLELHPDRAGMATLAHLKLAYLYLKTDSPEKAQDHFRTVYNLPEAANKDQAGFELARILEAEGKTDEALAIYGEVSSAFEKSPWGAEAKVRLTLLNPPQLDERSEASPDELPAAETIESEETRGLSPEPGEEETEDGLTE